MTGIEKGADDCIVVITTSDDQAELAELATRLVQQRLAACCQISGPITSHYVWDGAVQSAREWRCEIKTTVSNYEPIENAIRQHHHYDEPEIIYFRIDGGSNSYLAWIRESVLNHE